ncbi:HD-GYP domain-containing protein [Desulfacinum hydrothermale]|nr:HD domain-containing phosphohydrolase [Desulfacinum hydrothermale]
MAGKTEALNLADRLEIGKVQARSLPTDLNLRELGYVPFRLDYLFSEFHVPCALYVPVLVQGEESPTFVKVLERGQMFSEDWRWRLSEEQITVLYAEEADLVAIGSYFRESLEAALEDAWVSVEDQARMLRAHGAFLAESIFGDPYHPDVHESAAWWTGAASRFMAQKTPGASVLYRLFSRRYQVYTHCVQVALLVMAVCRAMGWRSRDIRDAGTAALYHDIGKAWVDSRILNKPGSLTREELEHIHRHPLQAHEHLKRMGWMNANQLEGVLSHHESMDGTGYPHGLKGKHIHPYARVIHVVDCFDAITTDRPYRLRTSPYKALRIMLNEMRLSFDHHILYKYIQFLGS